LEDSYTPGDLGFDPLGLLSRSNQKQKEMRTKELQNGRLAMLAVAGIVALDLVDGRAVLGS
jgi:Chlorophyll A-B binding protein